MSAVSRSVFQKKCEENKRLISDIRLLTSEGISFEKIECVMRWRKKFKKEQEFNNMLKSFVTKLINSI